MAEHGDAGSDLDKPFLRLRQVNSSLKQETGERLDMTSTEPTSWHEKLC